MNFLKRFFMSKEERAAEVRYALRSSTLSLTRFEKALEKRRERFIELGKKARTAGSNDNYKQVVKGIHLVNIAQNRARRMIIQLEIYSTMCDISSMSTSFVTLLGKVSRNIQRVISSPDFLGNITSFEKSIGSMGSSFENLELFLSKSMDAMEDGIDTIDSVSDEEITRMIDAEIAGKLPESSLDDIEFIKNFAKKYSGEGGSAS